MKTLPFICATLLLFSACGTNPPAEETEAVVAVAATETPTSTDADVDAPEGTTLRVYADAPGAGPDSALLTMQLVPDQKNLKAAFTYELSGFDLKARTPDAGERNCANSPDGQHLHFILNNKPYLAKYDAKFTEAVEPGHNVLLTFMSRSYHESLKDYGNYVLTEFNMVGGGGVPAMDLQSDPILFYSRPKGDYKKSDGSRVLLDFFLVNVTLARTGNRVRATIDGQPFLIYRWAPYFIEGLELGPHTVRLELLDKDGNLVPGAFNDSGERTYNLLEG